MSPRARVGIIISVLSLFTVLLIGKIFRIAVIDHADYLVEAKQQQQVEKDILPRRGSVYIQDSATGQPVVAAESIERYALSATPNNVIHKSEYAHLLASIAGGDEAKILASLNKPKSQYMDPVAHSLSKEQVETIAHQIVLIERGFSPKQAEIAINFDAAQGDIIQYLGGVFFIREYERTYPEGPMLGQVLGFVNDKGIGQYGFEGQYDAELKGYAGKISLLTDSKGTALKQTQQVASQDGKNYELTIDRNVQQVVEDALAAEVTKDQAHGGSVIVLDPKTGGIIAMASYPTYPAGAFRSVTRDQVGLFDNPAISSVWEPGSIFKPLIMAAAIDQGVVTADTADTFAASVQVDGYTINTALNKAYGHETMTDVLVNSDNVAMVWLGNKMGAGLIGDYIRRYGFGTVTGIDLKNEIGGKVTDPAKWSTILRATTTFGQGIAVTPIQIAAAYTAIANGGIEMAPRLVKGTITNDGVESDVAPQVGKQVMKPETAATLRDMLTAVVVHNHKKAGVEGYKVGGKTGTAQVPDSVNGGYLPNAYNHSFVGMAPTNDPKFVMLVKIDQPNAADSGEFAESTAVPLFGQLSRFLLHYYQVPPTH
jgi:stage V sporulation protein D (sporulation-specific penicillin-binding protein)